MKKLILNLDFKTQLVARLRKQNLLQGAGLGLTLLASLLTFVSSDNRPVLNVPVISIWLGSMLLLLVTLMPDAPARTSTLPDNLSAQTPPPTLLQKISNWVKGHAELIAIVSVTALGASLRFFRLDTYPSGVLVDEMGIGRVALHILEGQTDAPGFFGEGFLSNPALETYLNATSFAVFGVSVKSLRFMPALFGTLTVPALYWLGRTLFGRAVGLLTAFLMAVNPIDIQTSRISIFFAETIFFWVLSFLFLWKGLKPLTPVPHPPTPNPQPLTPNPRQWQPFYFSLAGICGGLSLYFYFAARLLPFIVIVLFGLLALHPRWRTWRLLFWLGLYFLGMVVAYAPQGGHNLRHLERLNERSNQVSIFTTAQRDKLYKQFGVDNDPAMVWNQLLLTLRGFWELPDRSLVYNFNNEPLLLAPLFYLVVMGLLFSLFYCWRAEYAFLHLWFWPVIIAGGALTIDAPYMSRVNVAFPVLELFAALGLVTAYRVFAGRGAQYRVRGTQAAFGLILAGIFLGGIIQYFQNYYNAYPFVLNTAQVQYLANLKSGSMVFHMGHPTIYFPGDIVRIFNPKTRLEGVEITQPDKELPGTAGRNGAVAFIIYPQYFSYLPAIQNLYPDGRIEEINYRNGRPAFRAYLVGQ